jgi:hypothetical protein
LAWRADVGANGWRLVDGGDAQSGQLGAAAFTPCGRFVVRLVLGLLLGRSARPDGFQAERLGDLAPDPVRWVVDPALAVGPGDR